LNEDLLHEVEIGVGGIQGGGDCGLNSGCSCDCGGDNYLIAA